VVRRWGLNRLSILCAAMALAIVADVLPTAAQGEQKQQEAKPAQIDRNGVLILVRSVILALDQANKTGNYTVLRDLGAPGFQAANTAAKLSEVFASQRNDKLDLSGVAVIDPQLNLLPQIEANGMMRMAGFFPSVPSQVNFELLFAPVDSQWRLFGLSVNVGPSGPVAPAPVAPASSKDPPAAARKQPEPKAPAQPTPAPLPTGNAKQQGGRG